MSLIILNVDEVRRTLSASGGAFVTHDKEVDIVRFAINSGFADIVLDGQVALRVMYQRPGETEVRAQTLTYYDTDGLHNYYDWQLSQSDLTKNGSLMVALCILDISGGEVSEWHTTPCAVRVLSTIHTDDSDEGDDTITPTVKERVAVLETIIQRVASGAPIVVSSTSAMTDTDQIYVLKTDGNWYYHNGTAWTVGGEYGAVATDTTLTQSGMAADAKVVGDEIVDLKDDLSNAIESVTYNYPINIKHVPETRGAIDTNSTWNVTNTRTSFMLKKPESAIEIVATASEEQGTYVCFLTNNTVTNAAHVDYCDGTGRNWIRANETKRFTIPDDCAYINLFKQYDGIVYTPVEVYFTEVLSTSDAIEPMLKTDEITPSALDTLNLIVGTSHNWANLGTSSNISVNGLKSITVEANDNNVSVVCFLKSLGAVVNYAVQYAENTGRNVIQPGETQTFAVPDDCKYINVLRTSSNTDYTPTKIWLSSVVSVSEILNKVESVSGDEQYGLKCDEWFDSKIIMSNTAGFDNPDTQTYKQGSMNTANNGNVSASGFIPISGDMVEFPLIHPTDATYPTYGYSLYDKDKNPILGRAGSAIPNRQEGEDFIGWTKVYIPKDAKYLRTTYWSDTYRESHPDVPEFSYNLIKYPPTYEPITHELPVDMWMQHAIRRARQLTDIKWSPRVKIPRYSMLDGGSDHFLDWFYPDKEYVGIPYSGAGGDEVTGDWTVPKEWGYAHNWVGAHIPFESFVTAARYPNSIFSETVEQTDPLYYSPPYGIVCTALVNYTVDGPWPLRAIRNFFTTDSLSAFVSSADLISDYNLDMLMIGDFLYTAHHVIVITDIIRDSEGDGHVKYVEMSEATTAGNGNNNVLGGQYGGVARRKMWDVTEFQNRYGAYRVFRRKGFWGIPYKPSKYVDTGNEGNKINIIDFPCIPYLGNAAVYKVGYIHNSKVLIGASGFTTMVVTKDGEAFGEFQVTGLTEVSVGFVDAGYYEAYLTNGTTRSKACNWTVEV